MGIRGNVSGIGDRSAMFFIFPFKNSLVSSFSPDDREWASGAMSAALATGAATKKTAASGVASLSRVTG